MDLLVTASQSIEESETTVRAGLAGAAAARDISEKRITKGTRDSYRSKIKILENWFRDNQYDYIFEGDRLKVPVETESILSFFECIGQNGLHRNENNDLVNENGVILTDATFEGELTKAVSTMGCCRSAIMDMHKQRKLIPQNDLVVGMGNYLNGFKRTIADLKLKGVMKLQEGKPAIPFTAYITSH
jgi:hypothetical protein